jgi:hypothetical protein
MFFATFVFFSLLCLFKSVRIYENVYNDKQIINGIWLSGAAYCGKENYNIMKLDGPVSDFLYKETIYDIKTDLQGYIGILPSTRSIYVVLRGSSSTMNWLDDFEVKQVPYTTYPECECNVHNGFYRSALGVKNQTITYVKFYQKLYPLYSVMVTGHSYGASVGQLLAMELEKEGFHVSLYNYGQPRVGDQKYADFVNTIITDYWRVTHNKDIVPHVPPQKEMGYVHSCREVFEDNNHKITICSEINCEDPTCANQYNIYQTNGDDHLLYLQHPVSCEDSTI